MAPPSLYTDLAPWWPLLSHPSDYDGEAAFIRTAFEQALGQPPNTLLELGSGGGNTASHLRQWSRLTLVDPAPGMLAVSRTLNPACEHLEGDMRSVRLGRQFDAVLIHDAIMYMTTLDDLMAALSTARAHVAPEGAVLVLPDYVAETYRPDAQVGGHDATDGSGRGLRYVEWQHPAAEGSHAQVVDFAILLREADGSVRAVHDRHVWGLFPRALWREAFHRAGFRALSILQDPWRQDVFLARPG